jgi:hypothetical protein
MNVDQVIAEIFADEDSGDEDFPIENESGDDCTLSDDPDIDMLDQEERSGAKINPPCASPGPDFSDNDISWENDETDHDNMVLGSEPAYMMMIP